MMTECCCCSGLSHAIKFAATHDFSDEDDDDAPVIDDIDNSSVEGTEGMGDAAEGGQ